MHQAALPWLSEPCAEARRPGNQPSHRSTQVVVPGQQIVFQGQCPFEPLMRYGRHIPRGRLADSAGTCPGRAHVGVMKMSNADRYYLHLIFWGRTIMLTPALVIVIDFGNILYWTAILFGACFALAAVGGLVSGVFSLFDKTNWAGPPLGSLYKPVQWERWIWWGISSTVLLLVAAFALPVVLHIWGY